MGLPRAFWVKLNRLRTGVGRFYSSMYKWGLAPSSNCECGAADQIANHVISTCPIHPTPRGVTGLTVLDDHTGCWLNTTTDSTLSYRFFPFIQRRRRESNFADVTKVINHVPITSKLAVNTVLQGPHFSKFKCFGRFGKQLKTSFSNRKLGAQMSFSLKFGCVCKNQISYCLLYKFSNNWVFRFLY